MFRAYDPAEYDHLPVTGEIKELFQYITRLVFIPTFFEEKKRILCYRSPSVRPSVCQQFTSISSYTIDARMTKLICMIPLCIQMVVTNLKFFYYVYFQFWNNSDFSDFTQKCNFSRNLSRNWFKFFMCMGMSYTSYIKRVLSYDFQITPEN